MDGKNCNHFMGSYSKNAQTHQDSENAEYKHSRNTNTQYLFAVLETGVEAAIVITGG